jgi:hypothetical protein
MAALTTARHWFCSSAVQDYVPVFQNLERKAHGVHHIPIPVFQNLERKAHDMKHIPIPVGNAETT